MQVVWWFMVECSIAHETTPSTYVNQQRCVADSWQSCKKARTDPQEKRTPQGPRKFAAQHVFPLHQLPTA
eukprot:m.311515 g.311515  ORF g.311515 m.311515 type:complete len:70 (+) comp20224_c0_seq2:24-233(+)